MAAIIELTQTFESDIVRSLCNRRASKCADRAYSLFWWVDAA